LITIFGDLQEDRGRPAPVVPFRPSGDATPRVAVPDAPANGTSRLLAPDVAGSPKDRPGVWCDSPHPQAKLPSGSAVLSLVEGTLQPYAAEQYRIIRTAITSALKRPFVLAMTSPSVSDGKTFTAINLAAALAMSGEGNTLLIDADLRAAAVHRQLRLGRTPGLVEVLAGSSDLVSAAVQITDLPSLFVLTGGEEQDHPTDHLDSPGWNALMRDVRRHFTHVVIDGPPLGLFADYDLIASSCDGAIGVVWPGHTDRTLCLSGLQRIRPKLLGVVINGAEDWFLWKKSHPEYYHHYYTDGRRRSSPGRRTTE